MIKTKLKLNRGKMNNKIKGKNRLIDIKNLLTSFMKA